MSIPIPDRVIGHVGDNLVETRSFELNRYYGEVDLSEFSFKLDTEINGTKNIIDLDKSVTEDKITLTWTVHASHVLHAGRMTIQLRAFHDDIEKWHSAQDYVIIQDSTNAPDAYSSLLPSEFEQMELRVTTLKEQAEASAQTATEQANRAQGIADEFENETLPAAIAAVEAAVDEQVDIAASHADRAQGIADAFSNTTLPAAISAVEAAGQAKVDLAEQQAERVEDIIQEAEQDVLPELRQAIEDGIETKEQLGGSIQEAGEAKTALDGSISSAGTAKGELDGSISSAGVTKTQLDGSISSANGIKSQLDGSITAAGQAKELLDESIATGDLANFKAEFQSHKNDYATYKDSTTLKVAKVERELNDYKATMQQVNINQEPKQKVSGYGTVSLPKNAANGQISDIRILGKTIYNHADNGVDYANWSISGAGTTKGVNGIHLVADAGNDGATIPINLKNATQYTLVYYVRAKDAGDTLYIKDIISDTKIPSNIGINKYLITTDITFNRIKFFLSNSETDGKYIDFEVYAILEGDYTADSSVNKPFKFGVNSTVSASRLKSVGKNLLPTSVNDWEQGTITSTDGTNYATTDRLRTKKFYRIPTATTYKASAASGYDVRIIAWYRQDYSFIQRDTITSGNITKPADAYWYKGVIRKIDDTTIVTSDVLIAAPQIEQGSTATEYEPYTESTQYLPNVGELRSLPNGTKDEINVTTGKATIRIGHKTDVASGTVINYVDMADGGQYYAWNNDGETETGVKGDTLGIDATTLTYQLAEPEIIPIQVSGSLTSHPNGTVYIEPIVADAGIYGDKLNVLHADLPIKEIEKVSKVDFTTGVETELDVSQCVVSEDKLSFTHPSLVDGDIVFFTYFYDKESTLGETEIEYYDSRHTIKDDVTGKFYKIVPKISDGVLTNELVEV